MVYVPDNNDLKFYLLLKEHGTEVYTSQDGLTIYILLNDITWTIILKEISNDIYIVSEIRRVD